MKLSTILIIFTCADGELCPIGSLESPRVFVNTFPFRGGIAELGKCAVFQVQELDQVEHPVRHLRTGTLEFEHGIAPRLKKPRDTRRMHIVRVYGIVKSVFFAETHAGIDGHAGILFAESKPGATFVLRE